MSKAINFIMVYGRYIRRYSNPSMDKVQQLYDFVKKWLSKYRDDIMSVLMTSKKVDLYFYDNSACKIDFPNGKSILMTTEDNAI